ncbi:uncharacterized protein si:ch211-167j6.3 isoform X2 [Pangasianodon hypophthalmus]|uniref:uncharacterized protein si:ch211-167j6.3 isoform X2 n=1 Tax=Pangasianodon hypophthalmus TaxID=310915 RepID=UPI001480BD89|nr:uncharacterized protein si:ch211-167j6.3 isoform X2 [Pangasianodon hypophthalmus]
MEPLQDNPQSIISSQHDKDVQDLLKRLKDATSKLQRVKSEREEVNKEVHQCREEMDRRMLLVLHVDDRVCDALMELEAAKQKKQTLIQLIQTLNTHARHFGIMQGAEAKQRVCECDAEAGGGTGRGGEQAETAV